MTEEPEPQRHTGHLIRRAQQRHLAVWTRLVSAEISTVQYSALILLADRGAMSQRELGDAIDLDRSTIADLVVRMERRGLLTRAPDPGDGRRKVLALTELGRSERDRLRPLAAKVEDALTGSLDPATRDALRAALRELLR